MAASNTNFYHGDLVIKNSQDIQVGKILETGESLSSDDEDEDEVEGQQSMKKAHIYVEWLDRAGCTKKIAQCMLDLNPNQEILPERKVKLYDRQLEAGDVVRRVGSEEVQFGYCHSTSVSVDVQVAGTQHVLTNIESTDLEMQEDGFWVRSLNFCFDMYLDGWRIPFISFIIRMINRLNQTIPPRIGALGFLTMKNSYQVVPLRTWKTLLAAKLNISSPRLNTPFETPWTLKKLYTYGFGYLWTIFCFWVISMHFVLWCHDSDVWSEGLNGISFKFLGRFFDFYCWLQIFTIIVRSKTLKEAYFQTALCFFSFRGLVGLLLPNFHNKLDKYLMENLKYVAVNLGEKYFNFLGYFFSCYCLFKSLMMLWCIWRRGLRRSLNDFAAFIFCREAALVQEEELTVEILVTQTRANVIWQDGTVEQNILSTKIYTDWDMWDEHDLFPGNHVQGREGFSADFRSYDYGVVKKVDRARRTAIIKWMKTIDEDGNPHPEVVTEQEVSVYDIIRHPVSGRVVISVSNLEPSSEEGSNEDDPIATDDQSPTEDPPLVPLRYEIEKQSKDATEGNATANENLLEGIREKDNMPKMDSPGQGVLSMLESVPDNHKYKLSIFQPSKIFAFMSVVKKEIDILKSSLPDGIVVKCFEDRMDLFSVLIKGPKMTPYEDGLFFFDLQLPADYPNSPPLCHYVSYCKGRLNPNLYEEGIVCVSLLGTIAGQGTQMWMKDTSNLLQVVVSIQGLILVGEPYYNEIDYEQEKGTAVGNEKSRLYNEEVLLKLVEAMIKLKMNPPELFQKEISDHFQTSNLVERLERWVEISETWETPRPTPPTSEKLHEDVIGSKDEASLPEFPLIPVSKGFCLTLKSSLERFKHIVANQEI